jgi:hypothetical protein
MKELQSRVNGASNAMKESQDHVGGTYSSMMEPLGHMNGATFAVQSPADENGTVDYLQPGPTINDTDWKRMEENGGLRPGKKWPQYLAASLGTWLFLCLILRVLARVQICITKQQKGFAPFLCCSFVPFFSCFSLFSFSWI